MYDFQSTDLDSNALSLLRFRMIRVFTRMLGNRDDAMEVAQEAFLRCWKRQKALASFSELNSWIFRIGLNAAKDYRKSAWKRKVRSMPQREPQANSQGIAELLIGKEEKLLLGQALHQLREEEKEVFLLRQEGGLTFDEIAQAVQRPVGTVETQFRTSLSKLRLTLGTELPAHAENVPAMA